MSLPRFALRRPILVTMALAAVMLFGLVGLPRLPIDLLPDLELPVVAVVTVLPGAESTTIEESLTKPIEGALGSTSRVVRLTSFSYEHFSLILAEFPWGTDVAAAADEVREGIEQVSLSLPAEARKPVVIKVDPRQLPVMSLAVTGESSAGDIAERLRHSVMPALERVPGVARVLVTGAPERAVRVIYDEAGLAENDLNPFLLQQILTYQNAGLPAGSLTEDGVQHAVKVGKPFASAQEIAELVIGHKRMTSEASGALSGLGSLGLLVPQLLTIGDVAKVIDGPRPLDGVTSLNGKPAVIISVLKESGANTTGVGDGVRDVLREFGMLSAVSANAGKNDLTAVPILDQSVVIRNALNDVTAAAVAGAALAIVIIFLFLKDFRSTLIIAVAIPVSIIATFVLMYFSRLSLNLMSLGGLALGIGMLVDNSIVVLENVVRHRQAGASAPEAAETGATEVTSAITASTLTTVCVFVPVIFVGGLAGRLFRELAVTVTGSLMASLVIALTVVPMLAARLLTSRGAASPNTTFERITDMYEKALRWCLHHRWLCLSGAALLTCAAAFIYPHIGTEFLAPVDARQFTVQINLPPGATATRTRSVAAQVESLLRSIPEVESVVTQVGQVGGEDLWALLSGTSPDHGRVVALLHADGAYKGKSTTDVMAAVAPKLAEIESRNPGAHVTLLDEQTFGGVEAEIGGQSVTVEVQGPDRAALVKLGNELANALRHRPGFTNVMVSGGEERPVLLLDINHTRALLGGLSALQVGAGVRSALAAAPVTYIVESGNRVPVVLEPGGTLATSVESLQTLRISGALIPGTSAPSVQVGNVTNVIHTTAPVLIQRQNGMRTINVSASLSGLSLGEAGRAVNESIAAIQIPVGYRMTLAGVHKLISDAFHDLLLAFLLAVALVYMVMAAQFESLRHPLLILLSVPLAVAGAILGLYITGKNLGVVSVVGIVMLVGIVVNNAIVLVDYATRLRRLGLSAEQAAIQAGCTRLRPILMTTATTLLGLVPMALGAGSSGEMESPLAVAVMGGLAVSTFLTLFLLPVVLFMVEDRRLGRAGAPPARRTPTLVAIAVIVSGIVGTILAAAHLGPSSVAIAADPSDALITPGEPFELEDPDASPVRRWNWERVDSSLLLSGELRTAGAFSLGAQMSGRLKGAAGPPLSVGWGGVVELGPTNRSQPNFRLTGAVQAEWRQGLGFAGAGGLKGKLFVQSNPVSYAGTVKGDLLMGPMALSATFSSIPFGFGIEPLMLLDIDISSNPLATVQRVGRTEAALAARLRLSKTATYTASIGWLQPLKKPGHPDSAEDLRDTSDSADGAWWRLSSAVEFRGQWEGTWVGSLGVDLPAATLDRRTAPEPIMPVVRLSAGTIQDLPEGSRLGLRLDGRVTPERLTFATLHWELSRPIGEGMLWVEGQLGADPFSVPGLSMRYQPALHSSYEFSLLWAATSDDLWRREANAADKGALGAQVKFRY